mgnify:FL=1
MHVRIRCIVKFGIFVAFDGLEGLVHISEIAWGHVKDPADYGKLGQEVDIMVIGVDGEKISLSMKRLLEDPWVTATKDFKLGDMVEGEINRLTPFGAFLKLGEDLNGLIHLSEIGDGNVKDPAEVLKIGDKMKAKIIAIDPSEHRIGLSIKTAGYKSEKNVDTAAKKVIKKKVKKTVEEELKEPSEEKTAKTSKEEEEAKKKKSPKKMKEDKP